MMIYLDNNATTKLTPEVKKALFSAVEMDFGNPSSPHSMGDRAREIIRDSREKTSKHLKCSPDELIFTSGGTEANTLILQSIAQLAPKNCVILTTPIEHSSVKKNMEQLEFRGFRVVEIDINNGGCISLSSLEQAIVKHDPFFISIAWANNETGVIQPLEEIAQICNKYGVLIHTDAAQFIGKSKIDLKNTKIDFLSFSGHKIHALQGVGCVYARDLKNIFPLIHGGDQENEKRAGTENVIGIVSLGAAIEDRYNNLDNSLTHLKNLRDLFEELILKTIEDTHINGISENRVVNTSNILFKYADGRALIAQLDNEDVIASQTSACTSMIPEPSYVLRAMGLSVDDAFSSVRFSFAVDNTIEDVKNAVRIIKNCIQRIRTFQEI